MNNPTDNLSSLITIMYDSAHKPKTELAGVNYEARMSPINDDHLEVIENNESCVFLPITHHQGHYFPSRILSHHETIGYAVMSNEAVEMLASDESLVNGCASNGKFLLQGFIVRSYNECA